MFHSMQGLALLKLRSHVRDVLGHQTPLPPIMEDLQTGATRLVAQILFGGDEHCRRVTHEHTALQHRPSERRMRLARTAARQHAVHPRT